MALNDVSAIDELQVVQLDEFQVNRPSSHMNPGAVHLSEFPKEVFPAGFWESYPEWLLEKVCTGGKFWAVPYYENISLLAYRKGLLQECGLKYPIDSWEMLAECARTWSERQKSSPDGVLFDFPKNTLENFNSLFFEILLSLKDPELGQEESGSRSLVRWLSSQEALKAARIFRTLCRPACGITTANPAPLFDRASSGTLALSKNAIVWRHWYSTLSQMFLRPRNWVSRSSKP
jgi:hypothetical protein